MSSEEQWHDLSKPWGEELRNMLQRMEAKVDTILQVLQRVEKETEEELESGSGFGRTER
jgi:hypothetical protein